MVAQRRAVVLPLNGLICCQHDPECMQEADADIQTVLKMDNNHSEAQGLRHELKAMQQQGSKATQALFANILVNSK